MLTNAIGLILADHKRVTLSELSQPRSLAAVPFCGRYRIIDFMLSNMINSGIKTVGVLTTTKYRSLMDHLGTGASWDLDRMKQGLSILPPFLTAGSQPVEANDLDGLLDFINSVKQDYVVLSDSNIIMNVDLSEFVEAHHESGADMSIMYNRDANKFGSPSFALDLDRGVLKDLLVDPIAPKTQRCAIGILVIARRILIDILGEAIARGIHRLSIESLLKMHQQFKIRGFEYKDLVLRINSVATYFKASMRMLERDTRGHLFQTERPVYTKVKNEAPANYHAGNFVTNSLLSDGCDVKGNVEDSILFRSVNVGSHASLKNCIIFQDCTIGEGAELTNVIVDKNTVIRPGVRLQGQPDYPVVIGKGVIV